MVFAAIGSIVAYKTQTRLRFTMLLLCGSAIFIVPAAQLNDQTAWSLDKHLAYGIWFATIAAGYACSQFIRWLPKATSIATVCCLIGVSYIGVNNWQSAWDRYHAWPNSRSFISAFKVMAAQTPGFIYVPGKEANIAQYYSAQGRDWTRWSASLSLDPVTVPRAAWSSYYTTQLRQDDYGLIVLFYATTFSSAPDLPSGVLLKPPDSRANREFLSLVGDDPGEPGLSALTQVIQNDRDYKFIGIGPYDSANANGIFAIWQRQPQK